MKEPDGYAVVTADGPFVGIWRKREDAELIVNRSPMAKGERIEPMYYAPGAGSSDQARGRSPAPGGAVSAGGTINREALAKDFLRRYDFYGLHRFLTVQERDEIVTALRRPILEPVPSSTNGTEQPINQCDGCRAGFRLDGDMHRWPDGAAFMICLKERYTGPCEHEWSEPKGFSTKKCSKCGAIETVHSATAPKLDKDGFPVLDLASWNAALDAIDRRLSEIANACATGMHTYYLHGLWRAREEIKRMQCAKDEPADR